MYALPRKPYYSYRQMTICLIREIFPQILRIENILSNVQTRRGVSLRKQQYFSNQILNEISRIAQNEKLRFCTFTPRRVSTKIVLLQYVFILISEYKLAQVAVFNNNAEFFLHQFSGYLKFFFTQGIGHSEKNFIQQS